MRKLEALTQQMDRMGKQFGKMSAQVEYMSGAQKAGFAKLEAKLNQALTTISPYLPLSPDIPPCHPSPPVEIPHPRRCSDSNPTLDLDPDPDPGPNPNPNYLHQVLTKENEQVFSYFMLKPKPAKGRMGRMLSKMKPKQWFSHSMLLVRGQG